MKLIFCPFLAIILMLSACSSPNSYQYNAGAAWGTIYHIKYASDTDLSDSITAVIRQIDTSLSPFNKNSLITAINAGECVKADDAFKDVLNISQQVCSISGGAFDPTVAPIVNLWGFGYREGASDRPTQQQIDSALVSVGILQCGIDSLGYVTKKTPATEFDFSAVAKGYGVDQIAAMLERNGCGDYMVEVGGEIALKGNGPSGDKWNIQIDAPVMENGEVRHDRLDVIKITDACIATSGNYRNHRSTSEGEVGHTISAVTGMPIMTEVLSATIIAPSTALADALATAVMAMPVSEATAMLDSLPSVSALLASRAADGTFEKHYVNYSFER